MVAYVAGQRSRWKSSNRVDAATERGGAERHGRHRRPREAGRKVHQVLEARCRCGESWSAWRVGNLGPSTRPGLAGWPTWASEILIQPEIEKPLSVEALSPSASEAPDG